jgi:hypothetical protein
LWALLHHLPGYDVDQPENHTLARTRFAQHSSIVDPMYAAVFGIRVGSRFNRGIERMQRAHTPH